MPLPAIRGRVAFVFGDEDFDVDQIVGIKNIKLQDVDALAALAMRAFDPDFQSAVRDGDVLVGGVNFGYGHPHYPSMQAMRRLGIGAVLAESFSPGYWRGEISNGFPQVAASGIVGFVRRWDVLRVDWDRGCVCNETRGGELTIEPYTRADREMLEAGGLIPYLQRGLASGRKV
jgi:3-isopropylmalate/(R)-2-methylmalate dehydratase small subunit